MGLTRHGLVLRPHRRLLIISKMADSPCSTRTNKDQLRSASRRRPGRGRRSRSCAPLGPRGEAAGACRLDPLRSAPGGGGGRGAPADSSPAPSSSMEAGYCNRKKTDGICEGVCDSEVRPRSAPALHPDRSVPFSTPADRRVRRGSQQHGRGGACLFLFHAESLPRQASFICRGCWGIR
jgi:hypothetical protein